VSRSQGQVKTPRAHIFISRIQNDVVKDDLVEWINKQEVKLIDLELLPSRSADQDYSSFHDTFEKGDNDFNDFLSPNLWPNDILVIRWYLPRMPKPTPKQDVHPYDNDYESIWN